MNDDNEGPFDINVSAIPVQYKRNISDKSI